jgi:hypothetical protein
MTYGMNICHPGGQPQWAKRATLISGARHFGVTEEEANEVISQLKAILLEGWRPIAREIGGSDRSEDQSGDPNSLALHHPDPLPVVRRVGLEGGAALQIDLREAIGRVQLQDGSE